MFVYKGNNEELMKLSKIKVYDYKKIKKCLKKTKKRNKRVLNCIDKVNRILDRENIHINKQCEKQIHNKMKGRMENPKVYMNEILFNKKRKKKIEGGNIQEFDFKHICAPFKYILSDYSILNNKLKTLDPKKKNKDIMYYYYVDLFLHIFLICVLIYLLFYIYYYNIFGI